MDERTARGNEITAGNGLKDKNGISISTEISERYDLEIDDAIIIDVAGEKISYIQSIREVNWKILAKFLCHWLP